MPLTMGRLQPRSAPSLQLPRVCSAHLLSFFLSHTHRWESAFQPHSVLTLIQKLYWEEEQLHTPNLAWERTRETAWMLPRKGESWVWVGEWWQIYPREHYETPTTQLLKINHTAPSPHSDPYKASILFQCSHCRHYPSLRI